MRPADQEMTTNEKIVIHGSQEEGTHQARWDHTGRHPVWSGGAGGKQEDAGRSLYCGSPRKGMAGQAGLG